MYIQEIQVHTRNTSTYNVLQKPAKSNFSKKRVLKCDFGSTWKGHIMPFGKKMVVTQNVA